MEDSDPLQQAVEALEEVKGEAGVPKNVKTRIEETISALKEDTEISLKVNKALQALEEIAEDVNMQAYTRTQIWNVVSLLEFM